MNKYLTTRKLRHSLPGFTVVELMVVIFLSTLLVLSVASFFTGITNQFAVSSVRGKLNTQLSTALNRIENDIQYSRTALAQNTVSDSAAPSGSSHWSSGEHQLVLGATARHSDNTLLNNTDTVDNIVYYLKNNTLYRRLLANPTAGNRYTTASCTQTTSGGCPEDISIADNINSFNVTYYTQDNIATSDVTKAASIHYSLTLTTVQSHQNISANGTMQTRLLIAPNQSSPSIPTLPPLTAGYGGISLSNSSATIQNNDTFSYGDIALSNNSTLTATNLSVAHKNCGIAATYGTDCPANPTPVTVTMSTINATTICGPTLPVVTLGFSGTANGTQTTDCELSRALPKIDKKALIDTIPTTNTTSGKSCPWGSSLTLQANYRYTGNITSDTCTITIDGGGVLYIEGNLTLNSNSTLKIANGITDPVTLIVNGTVTTSMASIGNSTSKINIISFYSSNSTCSNSTNCNSLDASDLYNSRNLAAITIGSNSNNYADLYAPFAVVKIDLSTQKSHVLYGQKITINQTYNVILSAP